MYLATNPQPSCARAWVEVASKISTPAEGYNVIIDVENPLAFDEKDTAITNLVDEFLRSHNAGSISTVANTIFPQAIYRKFGVPVLYSEYLKVFRTFTTKKSWGRYFLRLTRRPLVLGGKPIQVEDLPDKDTFNPLQDLIDKLKRQKEKNKCVKAAHELAIYDPINDRNLHRGGPCLSFLSFKRHPDKGLLLTAVYRNHTYITRCLGNLIGLGRLQAFVAEQVGIPVGSLTCVSTHAELDTANPEKPEEGEADEGQMRKWTLRDARTLVKQAQGILAAAPPQVEESKVTVEEPASPT